MKSFNFEEFMRPYEEALNSSGRSRYINFKYIIEKLVKLNRPITVIETGTMSTDLENNTGAFTLIFADLIKNWTGGRLITIDLSEKAMLKCREITREFSSVIEYITSDSVSYLESLTDDEVRAVDFFYFDSYDLCVPDPIPSQLHHYRELSAVYKRLNPNVILAVDDNVFPGNWVEWLVFNQDGEVIDVTKYEVATRILGKGTLIECFLLQEGWTRFDEAIKTLPSHEFHVLTYEKK